MTRIYLIRHGQPQGGQGKRLCLSETDLPLDEVGIYQAKLLKKWAKSAGLSRIYSSLKLRCVQTAEIMSGGELPVFFSDALREMDAGLWEGLSFDEIRSRFPEEYAERGRHMGTTPPTGGESHISAGKRLISWLRNTLPETRGDIAVVSHGGIIRGALCLLMGTDPDNILSINQPWGAVSLVEADDGGLFEVLGCGERPDRFPEDFLAEKILEKYGAAENLRAHGRAVAEKARHLAEQLTFESADRGLLRSACLLHDIARGEGADHAAEGAEILRREGYPRVADIIAAHHDLPENPGAEAKLLFLADKLVRGTKSVSLEERFEKSKEKCKTQEALKAWSTRKAQAEAIIESCSLNIEEKSHEADENHGCNRADTVS